MKPPTLPAAIAFFFLSSALAPAKAHGQFTGDRGRPMEQVPLVMRSLVIDVLSKGLQSGSRPLLRRALADTVIIYGVATDREAAIDAIIAQIEAVRRDKHRLILVPSHDDFAAAQQTVSAFSVADTAEVPHGHGEGMVVPHGGLADKSVRPAGENVLGGPDTLVRAWPTRPQRSKILSSDGPALQEFSFTLEDGTRGGAFRVTSISLAISLKGR